VVNCAEITDELAASRFFGHKRASFTGALTDEPYFFRGREATLIHVRAIRSAAVIRISLQSSRHHVYSDCRKSI